MFYLYHGTDTKTSLAKARATIKSLRTKRVDATFIEIDADNWSAAAIQEHIGGQGLFSEKYIIFLNRVTESAEAKEEVGKLASLMQESANIFIDVEGKLNIDLKKSLEKCAEKTVVSDIEKVPAKKDFNVFALGDALGARESGKAWALYRQAIDAGQEIEAIVGMMFWKIKTVLVGGYVSKYSKDELQELLGKLITIYHDGHRGLVDMELSVEKLLLDLH